MRAPGFTRIGFAAFLGLTGMLACMTGAAESSAQELSVANANDSVLLLARRIAHADRLMANVLATPSKERGWISGKDAIVSRGWGGDLVHRSNYLGTSLPWQSSKKIHVALGNSAFHRISIDLDGVREVAAKSIDGHVVYEGAYASTDLIMTSGDLRMEELILLRDSSAPTSFSWKVQRAPGVKSVVSQYGGLAFLDERDVPLFRVPAAYAIDASGVKRNAQLKWEADRVVVALDTAGLSYPILLDPAAEVAVWLEACSASSCSKPPVSSTARMAYDKKAKKTISYMGDTWSWDGSSWKNEAVASTGGGGLTMHKAPAVEYNGQAGFEQVFLLGGEANGAADGQSWRFDASIGTWTKLDIAEVSPARLSASMAFDEKRQQLVLFGGTLQTSLLGDLQIFDGTKWASKNVTPSPVARNNHRMVYDTTTESVLLFGGWAQGTGDLNDTWLWDGSQWTKVEPKNTPPTRNNFAMMHDSVRGRTVIFGGWGETTPAGSDGGTVSGCLGDTWEFDGTDWTRIDVSTAPMARNGAAMVFDSDRRRGVLFGGWGAGIDTVQDTWEYYFRGGSCTDSKQCDTGNCVNGACCEAAACPQCQSCAESGSSGVCTPSTGSSCDDQNECTSQDSCFSGTCAGSAMPDGTPCSNGRTCKAGICTGAQPDAGPDVQDSAADSVVDSPEESSDASADTNLSDGQADSAVDSSVPAQAAPESDSGCSCSTSSQRSGYFAWLAAIGALAFVMSRRLVVRERNLK